MINRKNGFTLVELLVVVIIVGILASVSIVVALQGMTIKATLSEVPAAVETVINSIHSDLMINGWPTTSAGAEQFWTNNLIPDYSPNFSIKYSMFHWGAPPRYFALWVADKKSGYLGRLCVIKVDENRVVSWYIYPDHPWAAYFKAILPRQVLLDTDPGL